MEITTRGPRDAAERMYAALNSTLDDLYPYQGSVIVTGKNSAGEIIELGWVKESALYEKGASPHALIDRVRFGL